MLALRVTFFSADGFGGQELLVVFSSRSLVERDKRPDRMERFGLVISCFR